jgi:hypothetical protein
MPLCRSLSGPRQGDLHNVIHRTCGKAGKSLFAINFSQLQQQSLQTVTAALAGGMPKSYICGLYHGRKKLSRP